MASTAPTASARGNAQPPLPDEEFWQRYSPHHEFPLSGIASITLYCLMGLLIYAGIRLALFDPAHDPLPIDTIEFDPHVGGGGGDPKGVTGGTGDKLPENLGQDPNQLAKEQGLPPLPQLLPRLPEAGKVPDILPPDQRGDEVLAASSEAVGRLDEIGSTAKVLLDGLRDKGKGGTGTGGGTGKGSGTGTGDAKGPGDKKPLSERQKRVLRWNMVFDTRNGEDYRRQLQSLGAILAIPAGDNQYLVIRDLRPPVQPAAEDLQKIQRIFWVDNLPPSVANLAAALGLKDTPPYFVAFFPDELEQKLAALEKRFAPNRREQDIKETRFRVMFVQRTGKYEPVVVDQR